MADRIARLATFLLFTAILAGCGGGVSNEIERYIPIVDQRLTDLGNALDNSQVRNAGVLREYARLLSEQQPDLTEVSQLMASEAGRDGRMYQGLLQRFVDARDNSALFASPEERLAEFQNLEQAADLSTFNDLLSDPVNVLADLSEGTLARVNAVSLEQSLLANQADDLGPGAQLIGNENYGQWQTGSGGLSFWEWYGMYALMDTLFDRRYGYSRRMSYGDWYSRRDYSYYSDYGRYRYSSPRQFSNYNRKEQAARKTFSNDKRFTSRYNTNRTGASKLSQGSRQSQAATNRFRSSGSGFSNRSAYSKNASFRNSRSSTSRGVRRGK